MHTKQLIISTLAGFVFLFIFDWVFHGMLLRGLYFETAHLWRTAPEISSYMPVTLLTQLWLAAIFTWIFSLHYENTGIGEGFRFGIYIGLLIAALQFGVYAYMPIPLQLAISWVVGGIAKGLGLGLVVAVCFQKTTSTHSHA